MTANYSAAAEERDGVEVYTLRAPGGATAEVAPALGCNCFAYADALPVLEPIPFNEFRQKPTSYGIPLLFPFPNRVRDGRFTFAGQTYEVNPPRHGFVRDKPWRVVASGAAAEAGAWVSCDFDAREYPEQILAQFPFPFRLTVTYRLAGGALTMETVAENLGGASMPAGFGIHPYFRKPERGTLTVPAGKRWELAESLPTGRLLDAAGAYDLRRPRAVGELQLDDIYTEVAADADGLTRCMLTDEEAGRETVVEFDRRQFPHVVVYTPPAPRKAVCVEPNTCPTDAFNLQARGVESDVLVIEPGAAARFDVRVYSRAI
ncbi:MAG TPA: aldose 1-epimerase [Pyrinomonadaceae bacterium]|jgi:aldose 1-epimerase